MIGRNIPLPLVEYENVLQNTKHSLLLELSAGATGANLAQTALFSLGLGPWMSAMIIWQLLIMIKKFNFDKLSKKEADIYQLILMLGIAVIEALGMIVNFDLVDRSVETTFFLVTVMTGGAFLLTWLANMNGEFGIGGPVLVVFFGMIGSIEQQLATTLRTTEKTSFYLAAFLLIFAIVSTLIVVLTVIFEKAEYRIPLNRILVNSKFGAQTYLPIKLNPCGAIAVMFGLSVLLIPSYLVQIMSNFFPTVNFLYWLSQNMGLNSYFGVSLYVLAIFSLSFVFGFINVDAEKISENLRNSGDYINGIRPGKATQRFLQLYVRRFSFVGATFNTLIAGTPVYLGVVYPQYSVIVMVPGFLLMAVGMVLMISAQLKTINILHNYHQLL